MSINSKKKWEDRKWNEVTTNKIPQEIEEIEEHECDFNSGSSGCKVCYDLGFKAGQKQTNEDVLKLIDDISRLYEDQEIVYVAEIKRLLKAGSKDETN